MKQYTSKDANKIVKLFIFNPNNYLKEIFQDLKK